MGITCIITHVYVVDNVKATVKVFIKLSIIATSRCLVQNVLTNIANSIYPDQCVCLCSTSNQQLRSYRDGTTA